MSNVQFPNYILEYNDKIQSGEIVAGKWIKKIYARLADDIINPKDPYVFDIKLATKPIAFIETFCVKSQGTQAGEPLKLELFQKAKLQAIFGFVHKDTRFRKYRETMTVMGRKNGKTTESAALSLFMLVGDGEGGAECYFVATTKDQASKGYNEAQSIVKQSPVLQKHVKKRQIGLTYGPAAYIKALASESNSLDGLISHFVSIDELAAIDDRNLYDVMSSSTSSREQPLISSISTNNFVRENIYDDQRDYAIKVLNGEVKDETFLPFLYELDHRDEWDKEDMWIKANPGLGPIKKIDTLRGYVEKAKVQPSSKPTVMVKDFNMAETGSTSWLSLADIENEETFDIADNGFRYGIGGFDMSETTDLTAATILMRKKDDEKLYVKSMFWLPNNSIAERAHEDKIPYDLFERKGILRGSGDHKIDIQDVLKWFVEVQQEDDVYIHKIGFDPWHVTDSDIEDFTRQFGRNSMVKVRQGPHTLSSPMKSLEADLMAKQINYDNNNLLKLCLMNTEIKVDTNGNISPVKGRSKLKRIDGTIALLCAYVVYLDNKNDYLNII